MAKFNNGYKNIKVELTDFEGDNLAKRCYEFSVYGSDSYKFPNKKYDKNSDDVKRYVWELKNGTTFPKFAFMGTRIDFSIEGISRICLAQLTRDGAIFCSESHGLRPLSQCFNIPMNIYADKSIMSKLKRAEKLLESAYVEACEKEIPFPESRYLCLHSQTISLCASYTPLDFKKYCFSRTNNSFCDELNYVYRKMFNELRNKIHNLTDENSKEIWNWIINEKSCIDDSYYMRTNVFNGDFSYGEAENFKVSRPAQNDWRKSCWKLELERIYKEEPFLLTEKEKQAIENWNKDELEGINLFTSYDNNLDRSAKNSIKHMPYYGDDDE